jgi:hypothetical protein
MQVVATGFAMIGRLSGQRASPCQQPTLSTKKKRAAPPNLHEDIA